MCGPGECAQAKASVSAGVSVRGRGRVCRWVLVCAGGDVSVCWRGRVDEDRKCLWAGRVCAGGGVCVG